MAVAVRMTELQCDQCGVKYTRDSDKSDPYIGWFEVPSPVNPQAKALIGACNKDCLDQRIEALTKAYPKWIPRKGREEAESEL